MTKSPHPTPLPPGEGSERDALAGEGRLLASYGRRRGRKLSPRKQRLLEELLPKISCHSRESGNLDAYFSRHDKEKKLWLEIGFGAGEHLAAQAARHPDMQFIGCEPYINGVVSLLDAIQSQSLQNIRIYQGDARLLLEQLPDECLDRVFILFPDPWPKERHHKRRLVNQETLNALGRAMKPGAELRLATDHADYTTWMLEQCLASPHFEWIAQSQADWKEPPADWVETRYEQKARQQGILPTYLLFRRVDSVA